MFRQLMGEISRLVLYHSDRGAKRLFNLRYGVPFPQLLIGFESGTGKYLLVLQVRPLERQNRIDPFKTVKSISIRDK